MANQFSQHYTRDQARALLPQIRQWLKQLSALRRKLSECDQRLASLTAGGNDVGGETVNRWVRVAADVKATLAEFQRREIQIKELDRGLIVFLASTSWLLATPANKAALEREFDRFLGTGLDRCTTCHLPSENKEPKSLDEFPHNPFGRRLREVGIELANSGAETNIPARLR